MAHTKAGGAKAKQGGVVKGKRRGVKLFGGQLAKSGAIIVRQLGTKFHPGRNTKLSRDHTIFAVAEGVVSYRNGAGDRRDRKFVDVTPKSN